MPFFRCGGVNIGTLARKVMISDIQAMLGTSFYIGFNSKFQVVANGFGVSNSKGTEFHVTGYSDINKLISLFGAYYYNTSTFKITSEYPYGTTLQISSGDPNDPHYPGSEKGSYNATIFNASAYTPSVKLDSFSQKKVDAFREIVGSDFKIMYEFYADTTTKQSIKPTGTWVSSLNNLLTEVGYTNLAGPLNYSGNAGVGGSWETPVRIMSGQL